MRVEEIGLRADRGLELADGVGGAALLPAHEPQAVAGLDEAGRALEGGLVAGRGLVEAALTLVSAAGFEQRLRLPDGEDGGEGEGKNRRGHLSPIVPSRRLRPP